jgi:hypothetical protein
MTTTDEDSVTSFDTEDEDCRRKEAYRLYKHYAKPTRASMCKIVDYHANDTDITRQDVDLLPWNLEETEVIKEVMKSLKKKQKEDRKDKKGKKKCKKEKEKEKECGGSEDKAIAKSKGDNKRPALLKAQTGYSSRSLDISWSDITGSVDISSTFWDQDLTLDHRVSAEQLQTSKVEEEHKRKREERQRKRDEATKKSMSDANDQERLTAEEIRREDTKNQIVKARREDRLERTFLWYTRMATPTRTEFKQQVAIQKVDITPEDVDLLAWNETGTRVKNIAAMNAMLMRTRILKH